MQILVEFQRNFANNPEMPPKNCDMVVKTAKFALGAVLLKCANRVDLKNAAR